MGSLPNLRSLATDPSSTYKFQLCDPDESVSKTDDCGQRKPNYRCQKGCTYNSQDEVSKLKTSHPPHEELFRLSKPITYHHKVRYTRSSGYQYNYNWQNFGPHWDDCMNQHTQTSFSPVSTRSSRSNAIPSASNTFSNIGHGIGNKRKDSLSSSGGASSVRRLIAVVRSTPSRLGPIYSRKVLCRNFAALCLGHFTVTAALIPLISLQSSISTWWWAPDVTQQQWDVGSLLLSGSFAVGSVFTLLSPTIIHLLGCNWTLVAGYVCTSAFFIAHFYPTIKCLIPAYVLFGICIGPLTCARISYLITLANKLTYVMTEEEEIYEQINGHVKENIIQKLSRGLQASQDLGMVLGNTVAWYFLYHSQNIEHEKNILRTLFYDEESDEWICGSQTRPSFERPLDDNIDNSTSVDVFVVSCRTTATLVSVFVGCGLVAVALTAAFTNKIRLFLYQDPLERPQGLAVFQAVKNAFRDHRLQLAAPMSIFIGLHNGFIHADFSKWYVVCSLGVPNISLVFLSMGLLQSIAAFTLSLLLHNVPRYLVIVTGFIFHSCLLLVLLIWKPSGDDSALFYVIAAAWGVCSIIWETLNFNLLLHIYPDSTWQVAFVHGNFFKFLGLSLAFGLHGLLSTWVKLYALAFFMIAAIGPHTWLEMKLDSKRKSALSSL